MTSFLRPCFLLGLGGLLATSSCLADEPLTAANVMETLTSDDWRTPELENTLYLELDSGTVVIELAPAFAPTHVKNLRLLVREKYFDGSAVFRSEENHVVQWGDPAPKGPNSRSLGSAEEFLDGEFDVKAEGLNFVALENIDAYAMEVGFVDGFPAARDTEADRAWLTHCNGMTGAGRGVESDSGNGAEVYVVNGHAERHLDRNVTLFGRVIYGMELLSTLPRGTGPIGRYETKEELIPVRRMRVASDVPARDRINFRIMRTDTRAFQDLIEARRNRLEDWFVHPVGNISLCRMLLPVERIE